ncbi:thiocillin family RiPP [Burkholderia multivorans]|uniref:thiocillin family RiPP n=1 Tax=Burkholderia multivorans TaxID=87883 RepID=UPI00345E11D3
MLGRDRRDAAEPDVLVRIVFVRDDERDVDAAREQHLQAAHADVVIRENDRARLHELASVRAFAPAGTAGTAGTPSCCSSTAWIR